MEICKMSARHCLAIFNDKVQMVNEMAWDYNPRASKILLGGELVLDSVLIM